MATIVLVHGIAQEQSAGDRLENEWLPALAGGVRIGGSPALADRLWRDRGPGAVDTRMAFYGNLFLPPGSQGGGTIELDELESALAQQLAAAWLAAAAERAGTVRDRAEAQRQLAALELGIEGAQGPRAMVRPMAERLARLSWFAPFGFAVAEKFVWRALSQVTRYFTDEVTRTRAQQQVLDLIGPETRLVIAHSLGTVVAYEALHRTEHPLTLLTLGSPLSLPTIIYPRLRPQPPGVPPALVRWHNLADRDDLVAAHLDLAPFFPAAPGGTVVPETLISVDNGAKPHDACHYLAKGSVGAAVTAALAD